MSSLETSTQIGVAIWLKICKSTIKASICCVPARFKMFAYLRVCSAFKARRALRLLALIVLSNELIGGNGGWR